MPYRRIPTSIIIVAALGARLDHTLGNIALLADDSLMDRPCSLDDGVEQVLLCRATDRDSTAHPETWSHYCPGAVVPPVSGLPD